MNDGPRLFADARGVWREDKPGHPFGIEWGEIVAVGGHTLDGITEVYTVVELDFEYGEYVELNADERGFAEVVQAITARLPGIRSGWFQEIERLGVGDPPITVWKNDGQNAASSR
jgi:hypothetical protein